jgi:hypothetical protein
MATSQYAVLCFGQFISKQLKLQNIYIILCCMGKGNLNPSTTTPRLTNNLVLHCVMHNQLKCMLRCNTRSRKITQVISGGLIIFLSFDDV